MPAWIVALYFAGFLAIAALSLGLIWLLSRALNRHGVVGLVVGLVIGLLFIGLLSIAGGASLATYLVSLLIFGAIGGVIGQNIGQLR